MLRNGIVIVITVVAVVAGSGDPCPELHTIIWKGEGKANEFYKRKQELYPSVQGSRVTN